MKKIIRIVGAPFRFVARTIFKLAYRSRLKKMRGDLLKQAERLPTNKVRNVDFKNAGKIEGAYLALEFLDLIK